MDRAWGLKGVVTIVFGLLLAAPVWAQSEEVSVSLAAAAETTKTRTELLNELSLKEALVDLESAQEAYERYKREYENARRFFDQRIIPKKELDEALSAYALAQQQLKQAEILLERTKLSFLENATHITIMEAKKYYDDQGRRMLDLVLKNTSSLAQAESALSSIEEEFQSNSQWRNPDRIRALLNIENIIVSIVDSSSSIGKPYEQIIPVLPYGRDVKLTFVLLTDVQQAGVKWRYLGQDVTENVYLEKESLQKTPTVVASQFSQEGELGTDINYDLSLEMLVTSDRSFSLIVTNLPPQINCSFVDATSGARITRVRFTEEVSKHHLNLRISIPQKLDVDMIDKTINFQAWVVTPKQLETVNKLKREYMAAALPPEKLSEIDAGRVDLALIPKGAGRLEIVINNLYCEIKPQQEVSIKADLHNTGTLVLFNIMPEISPPLGWTTQVLPKLVAKLAPGDKHSIKIHLQPAADVGVGEYEAQIEARGQSGSEVVEALERRLKIRIRAEARIATTLALVLGLVGLVVTIVIFGVRLSRR
jgi:hypothetical protein